MKTVIVATAALLLGACTTTAAELGNREVVGTYETTKPASEVAGCLAEAFSKVGPPVILDKDDAKIVEFHSANMLYSGSTVLMFTIANGRVAVQRANHLLHYEKKMKPCL